MRHNKILLLNPHADDTEISCGGTIIKLIEKGYNMFYVAFSIPLNKDKYGPSKEDKITEIKNALDKLGIDQDKVFLLDHEVRRFNEQRQNILDQLIEYKKEIDPDLVICPSSSDVHQDHKVIHEETLRAFKNKSIWGFESSWNQVLSQYNRIFVPIDDDTFEKKVAALKEYKSQYNRGYFSKDIQAAILRYHGLKIKQKYCESFECIREVVNF